MSPATSDLYQLCPAFRTIPTTSKSQNLPHCDPLYRPDLLKSFQIANFWPSIDYSSCFKGRYYRLNSGLQTPSRMDFFVHVYNQDRQVSAPKTIQSCQGLYLLWAGES